MLEVTRLNRRTLVIRVLAAAMLVVVLVQPGRAAISFSDGSSYGISGGTIARGIVVSKAASMSPTTQEYTFRAVKSMAA
jgi:preprotein translocase subunit SecG